MSGRPAATLQVSASVAAAGSRLIGGPVRLMGWSFNDGTVPQGKTVDQSAAAPGAGGTVASISLPIGTWLVKWTLELTGTVGAADIDNVQAKIGGTIVATSVNLGVAGNYVQADFEVTAVSGSATLNFVAIGAATAGSTYKVEANFEPLNNSTATISDGSGPIAFSAITPGGVDNQWFGDSGIAIDTELSVLTTLGTVQGVMWYYYAPERPDEGERLPVQEN